MIYNYLPAYIRGKNGWKRPKLESFSSWARHLGPAVLKEMHRRGIDSYVVYDSVMRQAGYETQYSGTMNAPHNYTNIKAVGSQPRHGVYRDFASDADWAKAYFDNILSRWPNALKAKSIYDYVMAIHPTKGYRYSETPRNLYYHNMAGVVSGSKAALQYWNDRKKLWKAWNEAAAPVDNTNVAKPVMEIPVPVDNTNVAKPVMEMPVPVEQHLQLQPTTYIDPTLLLEQPEEVLLPVVEDNYEASLLPSIQDAMLYFLPSLTPFANNDFMSLLVLIGLPGAKYGKDILPGFELGTPPPEKKTLHQKAMERYLYEKDHPFLANIKNNSERLKNEWDKFWDSNLFRFPAYLATGLVGGNVTGNTLLRARTKVRAAGKMKVPTAGGKTTYVVSPENDILGDLLGVYGLFLKTPVGALLPFKYGKDSGIHML